MIPPLNWQRNYAILVGLALIIAAAVFGPGIWRQHFGPKQIQQHVDEANIHQGKREAAEQQGGKADEAVKVDTAKVEALDARVRRLTAELAHARSVPGPLPALPAVGPGGVGQPEPAHPLAGGLETKKDELIEAQAQEIAALKVNVADLTTARDAYKVGLDEEKQVSKNLRAALTISQSLQQRTRSVGVSYDPSDKTWGGLATKDWGRLRAGVEVLQQQASGGQKTYGLRVIAAVNF